MTATHYPFTIDALTRDDHGLWTARLTIYGETMAVDRRFGAWRLTPENESAYRELPFEYASALQRQVRKVERAERRESV